MCLGAIRKYLGDWYVGEFEADLSLNENFTYAYVPHIIFNLLDSFIIKYRIEMLSKHKCKLKIIKYTKV